MRPHTQDLKRLNVQEKDFALRICRFDLDHVGKNIRFLSATNFVDVKRKNEEASPTMHP